MTSAESGHASPWRFRFSYEAATRLARKCWNLPLRWTFPPLAPWWQFAALCRSPRRFCWRSLPFPWPRLPLYPSPAATCGPAQYGSVMPTPTSSSAWDSPKRCSDPNPPEPPHEGKLFLRCEKFFLSWNRGMRNKTMVVSGTWPTVNINLTLWITVTKPKKAHPVSKRKTLALEVHVHVCLQTYAGGLWQLTRQILSVRWFNPLGSFLRTPWSSASLKPCKRCVPVW